MPPLLSILSKHALQNSFLKNTSHKSSWIGKREDDPAPLDAANEEDGEGQVAEESVRLAALVHPVLAIILIFSKQTR